MRLATTKQLLDATKKRFDADVASLPANNRKYLTDIYRQRYAFVQKYYSDSSVITDKNTEQYMQSILTEIVSHNPSLQNMELRTCFSRAYSPNALCTGEGTILFNIGLFSRLQNESQAAFVLCHEIAHQYLDHNNRHIAQYINTVYSDSFQRRLQQIKKAEYQKGKMLEETITGISFTGRRHTREHESEADSVALEFLKNTRYNISASLSCLALLDSADNDKYNVLPKPDSLFNFSNYPFQSTWLHRKTTFLASLPSVRRKQLKKEEDSLKTHPDCDIRMLNLKDNVQRYGSNDR